MAAVTLKLKVHDPPGVGNTAPVRRTPALPPVALSVPGVTPSQDCNVPPQGEPGVKPGGFAVTSPAGNKSEKVTPVRPTAPLLVNVNVSVVVPFCAMPADANDLVTVGLSVKVMVAVAVPPVPALAVVTLPVVLV